MVPCEPARNGFAKRGVRPQHPRHMDLRAKLISFEKLPGWRGSLRTAGRSLVVTNGCFDLLHAGHVLYLAAAREQGDALLVGLNSDASVRALKGADRPINGEADRAIVLAGLAAVDAVCVFDEVDALRFLEAARPDIYVKGGDYTVDTINQPERRLVEGQGGRVVILPGMEGRSTTSVLRRMTATGGASAV